MELNYSYRFQYRPFLVPVPSLQGKNISLYDCQLQVIVQQIELKKEKGERDQKFKIINKLNYFFLCLPYSNFIVNFNESGS